MSDYMLYQGDCLDILPTLDAGSVDAIICDPPYGTTACHWDAVIPFEPMWREIKRVLKPRGACVLFGSQPFTSALVMSNPKWFKYSWVWDKQNASNPQLAKYMPLKTHEDIVVFGKGGGIYNPQGLQRCQITRNPDSAMGKLKHLAKSKNYVQEWTGYPTMILRFPITRKTPHETEKPLALMRYLVRTYTNVGETVLDFTMGSGTTGEACILERRRFIGIEKDPAYFAIAEKRISTAANNRQMTLEELM